MSILLSGHNCSVLVNYTAPTHEQKEVFDDGERESCTAQAHSRRILSPRNPSAAPCKSAKVEEHDLDPDQECRTPSHESQAAVAPARAFRSRPSSYARGRHRRSPPAEHPG